MQIRPEKPEDAKAITAVHHSASKEYDMAGVIESLRREGDFSKHVSLVAIEDGKVVGHALFIDIGLTDGANKKIKTASLCPLGVLAEYQSRGIGGALVKEGLKRLKQTGYAAVLVSGDAAHYGKYGFTDVLTQNISGPYSGKDFMGLELRQNALKNLKKGTAVFPQAVLKMDEAAKSVTKELPQKTSTKGN